MRKVSPLAIALLCTLAAAAGSVRLWWLHAPRLEQRYIADYCRFTVGMPSFGFWPYRIETVQHLPITALPDAVFGGRPLYQVLLWPLVATAIVGLISVFIAATLSTDGSGVRVIRGPMLMSRWAFNRRTLFNRKGAFYIETQ
jgi:hypothetical protein